jgi:hypothetical protein
MGRSWSKFFSSADHFITKEDVTLWIYLTDKNPTSVVIKKNEKVKVLDFSTKWWYIEYKKTTGYASKHYFARRGSHEHEKKLWYFGELPRNEAKELLMQEINSEGSFLVRYSTNINKYILCVKKHNAGNMTFEVKYFDITEDEGKFWLSENQKFDSIGSLIENLAEFMIQLKLGDICLIGNPHSDMAFIHSDKSFD